MQPGVGMLACVVLVTSLWSSCATESDGVAGAGGAGGSTAVKTCDDLHLTCLATGMWGKTTLADWCAEDVSDGYLGLTECVAHKQYFKEVCGKSMCSQPSISETQCLAICLNVYKGNTRGDCIADTCGWTWLTCNQDPGICKK